MSNSELKYDVKLILEKEMPYLIKLLNNKPIGWTAINRKLKNKVESLREELIENRQATKIIDATIFSIIIQYLNKNEKAYVMFDFYNQTFEQLYNRLTNSELNHTHKMVKYVLTNLDYNYLNFIGEIATLNAFMSKGEFELLNIEEKIYKEKKVSADLFLRRKVDGLKFLVEIVNIHLENKENASVAEIEYFLSSKFREKIKEKFFNYSSYNLSIQPVIWINSLAQIKLLENMFSIYEERIEHIRIPMCYLTFENIDGTLEHRFEYVTTILKEF